MPRLTIDSLALQSLSLASIATNQGLLRCIKRVVASIESEKALPLLMKVEWFKIADFNLLTSWSKDESHYQEGNRSDCEVPMIGVLTDLLIIAILQRAQEILDQEAAEIQPTHG